MLAIDLSYEELDGYIQQICTGTKIVHVDNQKGKGVPLLFSYPTPLTTRTADLVYTQSMEKAKDSGLPSLQEMEDILRARGIFTQEDEDKIDKLNSRIKGQEAILSKTVKVPARRNRIYENIQNFENEIQEITLKKEASLSLSRERKASETKFLYLTSVGVLDPYSEDKFWENQERFDAEADFIFRKRVFLEYIVFAHGLRSNVIRYIARSNLWRIRYVTALKTSDTLFGSSIKDYNVDQLTLLYWSHFYQSVYEMMSTDRPPDTIIEDDQALDAYMKDWQAERNREATASRSQQNNKYGNNTAWDHGETLVMKSNPIHSDVEYSDTMTEMSSSGKAPQVDAAPMGRESRKTALTKAREDTKTN